MIHILNNKSVLRAGVVGTGAFGRHHAGKYASAPGTQLTAIADLSAQNRALMSDRYGVETFEDWRDLIGKVDLVSICSPAVTHAKIVRAFLEAGVHVLVEKPIATTLHEADALIALAEKKGLILTVGHQERFVFSRSGLMDLDQAPLAVSCWRLGPWTGRGTDVSAVLDLMIHDIDLMHQLITGDVQQVKAQARAEMTDFADDMMADLQFSTGTKVHLHASRIASERKRGMKIVYADGEVEIDFLSREIRNTTPRPLGAIQFDDPLTAAVDAFISSVRGENQTFVRPEEARLALKTALMIEDAAAPALPAVAHLKAAS